MRTVTFLVNIGAASDIEADVEVTEKEYRLMKEFSEEGEDFCDCEPLASLYERVIDAAYEAAADAADEDFLSEIMDVDEDYGHEDIIEALKENYELYPCWPDLDDEEEFDPSEYDIENMTEEEIEDALEEMIHVFCTDPRFEYRVFEDRAYNYFICHNDEITVMSSLLNDSPKGGSAFAVFYGPSPEEDAALKRLMGAYSFDEEFFMPLLDYLMEFEEGISEDYTPEDIETAIMEMYDFDPDDGDEDDDDVDPEMTRMLQTYRSIQTEIDAGRTPFADMQDFSVKLRRFGLDDDKLWYFYEGEYFDLWGNICECGDGREESDMSDAEWLELLIEIYKSAEE